MAHAAQGPAAEHRVRAVLIMQLLFMANELGLPHGDVSVDGADTVVRPGWPAVVKATVLAVKFVGLLFVIKIMIHNNYLRPQFTLTRVADLWRETREL